MIWRSLIIFVVLLTSQQVAGAQDSAIPQWILKEQFVRACEEGDVEKVKALLKRGVSPNARDLFNQPAILRAVRQGAVKFYFKRTEILTILLDAGANINAVNDFGTPALFLTDPPHPRVSESDNSYDFLVRAGANTKIKDRFGQDYEERNDGISTRATTERELTWRYFIEGRFDFTSDTSELKRYPNGATFAMGLAYYGDSYRESRTLRFSPEVDNNGETHLFYMASRTKFNALELVEIDRKVVDIVSHSGETALIRAARFDNNYMVAKLLAAQARTDIRDKAGKTALDYAVEYDYYLTTLSLLMKTDPNIAGPTGKLPLFDAVERGNLGPVMAFVNAKLMVPRLEIEAKKKPVKGSSDLAMAAAFRRIDPDKTDLNGMTPLMIAAEKGHVLIVEGLLKLNPNRNLKDKRGRTALTIAETNGNAAIVKLLTAR